MKSLPIGLRVRMLLAVCLFAGCPDLGADVIVKVAAEVIKSWTDDGGVTRTTPAVVETPHRHCSGSYEACGGALCCSFCGKPCDGCFGSAK